MKTALIYTRVSDPSQLSGLSLDVQREKCAKWAKENGYQVAGIYEDGGKSGTKTVGRHSLVDSIIHCQKGKIDALLVIDTDRIARNEVDHFFIKDELKKCGTQLIAINQPMIGDSPEGQFFETILAGTNAFYSRLTGRKVKKSMESKWEKGVYPSWAPSGYKNVNLGTEEKPNRVIKIDPINGPLVKELFELYATGNYSLVSLCKQMYKKGLKSRTGKVLSDSSAQQMISNTFYYGWMKWSGMEKWGNHKPLITKTLYDQCQFVAAKHRQFMVRQRKHNFLLRGLVLCQEHDARLTAEWHPYKKEHYQKKKIGYYHCHHQGGCAGSYIEVDKLEKKVAALLKKYQFEQKFIDLVRDKVKAHLESGRKNLKSQRQVIINQRKAIEQKRNTLEDRLIDGTISRDTYQRQHAKLQNEINIFDGKLADLENMNSIDMSLIDEVLALTRNIHQTYLDAPTYLKKHYLKFFFEAIYVKDKKIVKIVETPLFSTLRKQHHIIISQKWLPLLDSFRNGYKDQSLTFSLEEVDHFTQRFAHLLAKTHMSMASV